MEQNYATVGKRVLGGVIDLVIIIIFFMISARLFGTRATVGSGHYLNGFPAFVVFAIVFLYFVILEVKTGKTIGKYVAKTKVVNQDGKNITWGQAIARTFMRIIDGFCFYLVAFFVVVGSQKKQRLGDMVAKTYVIDDK